MASYTNVEVPDFYSRTREWIRRCEQLELQLKEVTKERDWAAGSLQNIMRAVREWGYVDLRTEDDKDWIRLVEKPQDPTPTPEAP
jgi:hypothetical protein